MQQSGFISLFVKPIAGLCLRWLGVWRESCIVFIRRHPSILFRKGQRSASSALVLVGFLVSFSSSAHWCCYQQPCLRSSSWSFQDLILISVFLSSFKPRHPPPPLHGPCRRIHTDWLCPWAQMRRTWRNRPRLRRRSSRERSRLCLTVTEKRSMRKVTINSLLSVSFPLLEGQFTKS